MRVITGSGLLFFLFSSCAYNRPFVATPFEPVVVKEKGDVEVNCSMRPFNYYSLNVTGAVNNFMACRVGYGGFERLDILDASFIFFKDGVDWGIFVAPTLSYQHNYIHRGRLWTPLVSNAYDYNCEYLSPSLVMGFTFGNATERTHQFIFKTQYNIVNFYSYDFHQEENSASDYRWVSSREQLNRKIPSFISVEPNYTYLKRLNKKLLLKFQVGFNIVQKTYSHYFAYGHYYPGLSSYQALPDRHTLHPVSCGMNIGVGLIFAGNCRKNK
jgi:hypothetical protein